MGEFISSIIKEMILYFDGDVRRINHALKVHSFAKSIGQLEGIVQRKLEILEVASTLHDIGIKQSEIKYNSTAGKYQEIEGPPIARMIIEKFVNDEELIERACFLVGHHHSYGKIDDIDFQILVEADFIVNIFEDSMDADQIKSIGEKYFKTSSGVLFLKSMYPVD